MSNFLERVQQSVKNAEGSGIEYETELGLLLRYRPIPVGVLLKGKGIVPDKYDIKKYKELVSSGVDEKDMDATKLEQIMDVMNFVTAYAVKSACNQEEWDYIRDNVMPELTNNDIIRLYRKSTGTKGAEDAIEESFSETSGRN